MKFKNKLLVGSLITSIGVIAPLATIVSCGNTTTPLDIENKMCEINDGLLKATFTFNSKETITQSDKFTITVKNLTSEGNIDFKNPENPFTVKRKSFGTKQLIIEADLSGKNGSDVPSNNSKLFFDLEVKLTSSSETKYDLSFEGFQINFGFAEANITPLNNGVFYTFPQTNSVCFEFDLNNTYIPEKNFTITPDIKVTAKDDPITNIVPDETKGARGIVIDKVAKKLRFYLTLQGVTEGHTDDASISFKLEFTCRSTNASQVFWIQSFDKTFTATYTAWLSLIEPSKWIGSKLDHDAGSKTQTYKLYLWNELQIGDIGNVTATCTDIGSKVNIKTTVGSEIKTEGDFNYVDLTLEFSNTAGEGTITFDLMVEHAGSYSEISPDVFTSMTFEYIDTRLNDTGITKEKETVIDNLNQTFEANFSTTASLPEGAYIYYSAQGINEGEKVYIDNDGYCSINLPTVNFSGILKSNDISQWSHQSCTFNVVFYAFDASGYPLWKQTINNYKLTYVFSARVMNPTGFINPEFRDDNVFATIDVEFGKKYENLTVSTGTVLEKSSDVEGFGFKTTSISLDDQNHGEIMVYLTEVTGKKLNQNSFCKFSFPILSNGETITTKPLEFTLYNNGTIEYIGSVEKNFLQTEVGQDYANVPFALLTNPKYKSYTKENLEITVTNLAKEDSTISIIDDWDIDPATGYINLKIKITPNRGYFLKGDDNAFNLEFKLNDGKGTNIWAKTIENFKITYTPAFDYDEEATTGVINRGELSHLFAIQNKVEITDKIQAKGLIPNVGNPEFLDPNVYIRSISNAEFETGVKIHSDYESMDIEKGFGFGVLYQIGNISEAIYFNLQYYTSKIKVADGTGRTRNVDIAEEGFITEECEFNFTLTDFPTAGDTLEPEVIFDPKSEIFPTDVKVEALKTTSKDAVLVMKIMNKKGLKANDYFKFDLKFTCKSGLSEKKWEQTVSNFSIICNEQQPAEEFSLTEMTKIQYDAKGHQQTAAEAKNGLVKGDKKGKHCLIAFNTKDWKPFWEGETPTRGWKMGSYYHPSTSWSGYYHYAHITVKLDGAVLQQSEPGGDGEWWVSEGGPITINKPVLDGEHIFTIDLVLDDDIDWDTNFYFTYF